MHWVQEGLGGPAELVWKVCSVAATGLGGWALSRRFFGGLLYGNAVEGFQRHDVIVLLALGGKFTGADGRDVEELLDHATQRELDFFGSRGAAVLGTDPLHFSIQDTHGVPAKGNNRGVGGPGLAGLFK